MWVWEKDHDSKSVYKPRDLHCWCWPWSSGRGAMSDFPLWSYSLWPPSVRSLESSHCTQPRVKEGGAKATSLRLRNLHRLFGIILHRTFVSFPPFVYLPNLYLYQHGLLYTNFILWIIIQHYFTLSLKHSQCLSWKLFQWAPGSLWHTPSQCGAWFCLALSTIFLSGTIRSNLFIKSHPQQTMI